MEENNVMELRDDKGNVIKYRLNGKIKINWQIKEALIWYLVDNCC